MEPISSRTTYYEILGDAGESWKKWNETTGVVVVTHLVAIPCVSLLYLWWWFGWGAPGPMPPAISLFCGAITVGGARFLVFLFLAPFRRLHLTEDELRAARVVLRSLADRAADRNRWTTALHLAATVIPQFPTIRARLEVLYINSGSEAARLEIERLIKFWHDEAKQACPEAAECLIIPASLAEHGFNANTMESILNVSERGFTAIVKAAESKVSETPTIPANL